MSDAVANLVDPVTTRGTYTYRRGAGLGPCAATGGHGRPRARCGDGEAIPDGAGGDARRRRGRWVRRRGRVLALEPGRGAVDTHRLRTYNQSVLRCDKDKVGGEGTYLAGVALARIERAGSIVSGHVPIASHYVVDVLAECGCIRAVFTDADAKFVKRDEVLWHRQERECKRSLREQRMPR